MKFCCIQKQIVFENESRWEEVSLLHRIKLKMLSTTNSIESSHGHLNKRTPRRNSFYGSYFRIINELILKYGSINKQLQHNYNFLKRKTMNQLKALDYNQLRFQMIFYETTEKTCLCGQNKLECALYNIDIPCIHRLALGVQFPSLPQIDLNINFLKFVKRKKMKIILIQRKIKCNMCFNRLKISVIQKETKKSKNLLKNLIPKLMTKICFL